MTDREILEYIDRMANFYVSLFGRAEHMEMVEKEHYSYVRPKGDIYGISFAYDLRLEGLPRERQRKIIAQVKALGMPVWLNLTSPDEVIELYTGRKRPDHPAEPAPDDEAYLAMLPKEKPDYPSGAQVTGTQVIEVRTQEEFARWAGLANRVLSGGKEDLHPEYHYPLCRDGLLRCYMALDGEGRAVSAASAAVDREAASLEFVATLPEFRRWGLAAAVCRRAVNDAFKGGAEIITVRAIDGRAAALYSSLGFKKLDWRGI